MPEIEQPTVFLHELRVQARQRGELARAEDLRPEYWFGVQFGFEEAADRLEALLKTED